MTQSKQTRLIDVFIVLIITALIMIAAVCMSSCTPPPPDAYKVNGAGRDWDKQPVQVLPPEQVEPIGKKSFLSGLEVSVQTDAGPVTLSDRGVGGQLEIDLTSGK